MLANTCKQADRAFASVGLQAMSSAARVIAAIVVAGGVILTLLVLVLDLFSEHPSSTAALVLPWMALYIAAAVAFIALVDWGVRRIARK